MALSSVTPKRAAIYTRISADPSGDALGVQRQEEDARRLCERRGWQVVEVFCDNDRSAYAAKRRPAYERMLDAVRAGRIDVIVAWHPDRLHRRLRELVPFIDLINEHGVDVETVTAGRYDLSTPTGRMQARILGTVAEYESEHKAERIRRRHEQNAAAGREHGGHRPYGWTRDRKSIVPEEAAVVREAAARILAGESVRGVARSLNKLGYRTASGKPWRDAILRAVLLRPRNAGLRVHRGEVIGRGTWQPILDDETYHQVVAVLTNPNRREFGATKGAPRYLLSGIALCGVCGERVHTGHTSRRRGQISVIYRCSVRTCVSRRQVYVDDFVTRVVLARLSRPDARHLLVEPDDTDHARKAAERAAELEQRLQDAAEAYAAGTITLAQLTRINATLRPKLEMAQAEAATPARSHVLGELVEAADPAEVWEALPLDRQRAVVNLLMTVRILPAKTRGGRGFDPETVEITWKV